MLFWNLPSCPKHLGWLQKKHMMAGQNKCKEKVPDCHTPIKMLKLHATPNSSLHDLKIYSSKGRWKASQGWIYVAI